MKGVRRETGAGECRDLAALPPSQHCLLRLPDTAIVSAAGQSRRRPPRLLCFLQVPSTAPAKLRPPIPRRLQMKTLAELSPLQSPWNLASVYLRHHPSSLRRGLTRQTGGESIPRGPGSYCCGRRDGAKTCTGTERIAVSSSFPARNTTRQPTEEHSTEAKPAAPCAFRRSVVPALTTSSPLSRSLEASRQQLWSAALFLDANLTNAYCA